MKALNPEFPTKNNNLKKILLRWFFSYFIGFALLNFPLTSALFRGIITPIVKWIASALFNNPSLTDLSGNGAGDALFDYYIILFLLLFSSFVTLVWSLIHKNKQNLHPLLSWFIVLLRYYLWINMTVYGMAKVFELQFASHSLSRLLQTYGETEPMTLLWTFMGHSRGYQIFLGLGEVIAGLFLLNRKSQTLGALLTFAIMINVVIINFSFDVAVKIFASHLVLFSAILLVFDRKRLLGVLFSNNSIQYKNITTFLGSWEKRKFKNIVKYLGIVLVYGLSIFSMNYQANKTRAKIKNTPLYGIYDVTSFTLNEKTQVSPENNNTIKWKRIVMDFDKNKGQFAYIEKPNGQKNYYSYKVDTTTKTLKYYTQLDTILKYDFKYITLSPKEIVLKGINVENRDSLNIHLNIRTRKEFALIKRNFRWVIDKTNKSEK